MFATRRALLRSSQVATAARRRALTTSAPTDKSQESLRVWNEPAAYPVIGVVGCALTMLVVFTVHAALAPETRVSKTNRTTDAGHAAAMGVPGGGAPDPAVAKAYSDSPLHHGPQWMDSLKSRAPNQ